MRTCAAKESGMQHFNRKMEEMPALIRMIQATEQRIPIHREEHAIPY